LKRFLAALAAICALCSATAWAAPDCSARSALLMDKDSGRILYAQDIHTSRPMASVTKLMTALVAAESGVPLDRVVTVTRPDTDTYGSSMYLKVGEEVTVEELLYGLLLHSGNDAALTLARVCGGSVEGFVEQMNTKAAALGMEGTHFTNPNGLDEEGHYTTAYDLALLARACLDNETVSKLCATWSATVGTRHFVNHNKLLVRYEGCIGMKTGYTDNAGRTLVTAVEQGDTTLICVTLHDRNDYNDHAALYDYGFSSFATVVLAEEGETVAHVPVAGSLVPFVPLVAEGRAACLLGSGEAVERRLELPQTLTAPLKAGERVGEAVYTLNGAEIARVSLLAAQSRGDNIAPPKTFWEYLF